MILDHKIVCKDLASPIGRAFEHSGVVQLLQLDSRFVFLVNRNSLDLRCLWVKRTNDNPRSIAQRVHTEERMRRAMLNVDKTVEFRLCQNHPAQSSIRLQPEHKKLPRY